MNLMTVTPARWADDRYHYVPELGRTDYGAPDELIGQANAERVVAELAELGVEAWQRPERTWLCATMTFLVDAYHPATVPYLSRLAERLDVYPVLDEMRLSELEYAEGYCAYCGNYGLPPSYGEGDTCESCGYDPMA